MTPPAGPDPTASDGPPGGGPETCAGPAVLRRTSVWRAPLLGGSLVGTALLLVLLAVSAHLEGGTTSDERRVNAWAQAAVLLVAAGVLGFYARRILLCAFEDDRPVPWGRDERDVRSWTADVGGFVAVAFLSFLPLVVWAGAGRSLGAAPWVSAAVSSAGLVYATAVFPFAHAAVVLRGTVLAGTPSTAFRALRANPVAARSAITPTFAFIALFAVSAVMSGAFNPSPEDGRTVDDRTAARNLLRAAVFVVRAASVCAALASFRSVGLLAREAPEVGEVLR